MRYFLLVAFSLLLVGVKAQKYALLDKRLAQPVTYTDRVTQTDKFNGLFPVEKKQLPKFIIALQEISKKLSTPGLLGDAKQYQIGCTKFTGLTITLATGDRLDYVITSNCGDIIINMHLSDAKSSNAINAFFIDTWIKYIKSSAK
ncbi:MAG: hypothetical protein ABIO81_09240 [Ginsengibacter sp.]